MKEKKEPIFANSMILNREGDTIGLVQVSWKLRKDLSDLITKRWNELEMDNKFPCEVIFGRTFLNDDGFTADYEQPLLARTHYKKLDLTEQEEGK